MTPRPGKIPVKSFRVSTRSVPRFEVTADARPPPARASPRPAPPARAIDAQSFPPPFPIVSQGSPRSRARPHPPARRREIPRARRVGFRCRTSSRRVRASRVAPFRATFDASVRDLFSFRSLAKSRARIERSERRARRRRVSRARPAVRAPRRLHRGSCPVDARGPREMDRAVESRFVVRRGGRRARREDSVRSRFFAKGRVVSPSMAFRRA